MQPVRPPDADGQIADAPVAERGEVIGELGGCELPTALVHDPHSPAFRQGAAQQLRFGRHAAALAVLHLGHAAKGQAQAAPGLVEPRQVIIDQ